MTFASLSPWMAWLVITTALALATGTFMIRPRPSRMRIPSLVVWRRVDADPRERSMWDRARRIISLVLTVAIAGAIALAFTRPMPAAGASASSRTLVVIDSSWSMNARTPSGVTRWAQAVERARGIADATTGGEIAVATTADGVIEGPTFDRSLIRSAFDRVAPSGARDGAWPRIAGATTVHFFTDGAVARALDPDVIVHSVFTPASNVAVTGFDVQPSTAVGGGDEAFVAVANYASRSQVVRLVVTRGASVILDRSMDLAAGAAHREVIALAPGGEARFHARVSANDNALEIDDDRAAWLSTARPLQVAVVADSGSILALLAKDRSLHVFRVDPAAYSQTSADVWIFDGWLPPVAPNRPALVIDPPPSPWPGPARAEETDPVWRPGGPHPILNGVDTALVRLARAHAIARPSLLPIAVSERETPLVSVEDSTSGRLVVLGFSADADFAATPAFPILIGNAIDWLGRAERDRRRQPGPLVLPAATRRVIAPNGTSLPLAKFDDRVTTVLPAPGLFLVESTDAQSVLVVELADPLRSNLLASSITADSPSPAEQHSSSRPWWYYAAFAAFGFAGLEWVTWRRRLTV